jgi:hypothetical protein
VIVLAAALASRRAVTASSRGLKVLLVKRPKPLAARRRFPVVRSGCTTPTRPGPPGITERRTDALLPKAVIGAGYNPALIDAFIEQGREALRYLEAHSELSYSLRPLSRTITGPARRYATGRAGNRRIRRTPPR